MPAGGGSYGGGVGDSVASELKRKPAMTVSYVNTKRQPRSKPADHHFGHVKSLPNPK